MERRLNLFDLNCRPTLALMDCLSDISRAQGGGPVTSISRAQGDLSGIAFARPLSRPDGPARPFRFRIAYARSGAVKVYAKACMRYLPGLNSESHNA